MKTMKRDHIMETRSQARKRAKERDEMKMDRLSTLPDAIILLILTFLDTKYAVQTSVLSRRWNNLWTHLPILNFSNEISNTMESFERFVRKVISLRNPSINLSSLSFHYGLTKDFKPLKNGFTLWDTSFLERFIGFRRGPQVNMSFIDRVIKNAISNGVQEMDISFSEDNVCLTPCIFTCGSLKTLRLHNCQPSKNVDNSWGFRSLTTLHLCKARLPIENESLDLFPGCANLENLFLLECYVGGFGVCTISAPRLVNLTISHLDFSWLRKKCIVVVSGPRLTNFNYEGFHPIELSRDQCPVLDRVNIFASSYHTSKSQRELPDLSDDRVAEEYFSGWNDLLKAVSYMKKSKFHWDIFPRGMRLARNCSSNEP